MAASLLQFVHQTQRSTSLTIAMSAVFRHAKRPRNFWLHWTNLGRHSGMRRLAQASDVQLHIGESILPVVVMDSGLARKGSRPGMTVQNKCSAHQTKPDSADIERQHCGVRDVEAFDLAG